MDHVEITEEKIEVGRVTNLVSSPVCGATSVFIGKRLKLSSYLCCLYVYDLYPSLGFGQSILLLKLKF